MLRSSGIVRIAVVGDEGTGKTSLISTAANDTFDVRPPPVLPPTKLPPEFNQDQTPMLITDTSSRPEDVPVADIVIQQADVVVVCFDPKRHSTLDSIRSIWYPRIQQLKPDMPVIIACCKADTIQEEREQLQLRERVEIAVHDLPHVEVCLNCSAKTLRVVADIFSYALQSVLYPLHPLYDRLEKRLRPLCAKALKRAFIMCDADQDGALSDQELNNFQVACFDIPLAEEELQNVKQMVLARMPMGVCDRGLTLEGFLFLHVLFIERGVLESVWAVLRKFGYNDDLHLNNEILDRIDWSLPPDQVYELSQVALDFLCCQFTTYDEDADGLITWQQLEHMFSTVPPPVWNGDQWSRLLVSGTFGAAHRRDAFLMKWRFSCLHDPRSAVAHLLYLGYGGPGGSGAQALLSKCCRRRPDKPADMSSRSTLLCYVFGPHEAGKSALLKALAADPDAQSLSEEAGGGGGVSAPIVQGPASMRQANSASQSVPFITSHSSSSSQHLAPLMAMGAVGTDKERVMVMEEVPCDAMSGLLESYARSTNADPPTAAAIALSMLSNRPITPLVRIPSDSLLPDLSRCDVAAFVFDSRSPSSFQAAADMMAAVSSAAGESLPCLLVAAKDDLGMAPALNEEVTLVCGDMGVPRPIPVSVESGQMNDVFKRLVVAALLSSEDHVPDTPARKAAKRAKRQLMWRVGGTGSGLLAAFALYKLVTSSSGSSESSGAAAKPTTASSLSQSSTQAPAPSHSVVDSLLHGHTESAAASAASAISQSQAVVESLVRSAPDVASSASQMAGAVRDSIAATFGSFFK